VCLPEICKTSSKESGLTLELLPNLSWIEALRSSGRVRVVVSIQLGFADVVMRFQGIVIRIRQLAVKLERTNIWTILEAQTARGERFVQNREGDFLRIDRRFPHQETVFTDHRLRCETHILYVNAHFAPPEESCIDERFSAPKCIGSLRFCNSR